MSQAYRELKRRILTCHIPPRARLDERRLAAEIGVGRDAFREACYYLVRERLLRATDRGGFTATGFNLADIRELCELRRIVESKSAALAAARARSEQVARLLALAELNYQPGRPQTYERYLQANTAFHQGVAHATGNARLEAVVGYVLEQINRLLYLGLDVGIVPRDETAKHLRIVDAVRRGRPSLASRLMWEQLGETEKRIVAAFAKRRFSRPSRRKLASRSRQRSK